MIEHPLTPIVPVFPTLDLRSIDHTYQLCVTWKKTEVKTLKQISMTVLITISM